MSSRKRPATEELHRPRLIIQEPIIASKPGSMGAIQSVVFDAVVVVRKFISDFFSSPAQDVYTNEVNRHNEAGAERQLGYRQTTDLRTGNSTTVKRQRTDHSRTNISRKNSRRNDSGHSVQRTRSVGEGYRAGGRRRLNEIALSAESGQRVNHEGARQNPRSASEGYRITNRDRVHVRALRTEPRSREAVDNVWLPREHGLLKDTATFPQSQIPSPSFTPPRERSDSRSSYLGSPSGSFDLAHGSGRSSWDTEPLFPRSSKVGVPRPLELAQSTRQILRSNDRSASRQEEFDERLKRLLIDEDEVPGGSHLIPLSSRKRSVLEESRRQRELLEQEEQRIEKKKRLEAEAEARLKRRQPRKPLIQPLDRQWEDQVNNAIDTNDQSRVVSTSIGGTELIPKDFRTLLEQRAWLNDEIINSYIEWVVDAANKIAPANAAAGKETPVPKFLAHNSFFYENITKKGPTSTDRLMKRKGAPGKTLLQVDTVIVPICRSSHWTVGAVRPAVKTIEYFDSFGGQSRLGKEFISHMRSWLQHQLGDTYVASEWKEPNTGCASQSNGWDCGVFVCTNAFCVAFGLETSCYVERDMELQRRRIAAVLINRGFHGDFSWSNGGL